MPQLATLQMTGAVELVTQGSSTSVGMVGVTAARFPIPSSLPPSPTPIVAG